MDEQVDNKTFHATGDYGLIQFLIDVKKVCPVAEKTRKIRRGKMEYVFSMAEPDWMSLRIEYSNSVFPKFLQGIKLLKDPSF